MQVYRDAIKFVHDQTIRYTEKGWHPDEIADYLRLPASINDHIYLHQYYGTVEWSVRGNAHLHTKRRGQYFIF